MEVPFDFFNLFYTLQKLEDQISSSEACLLTVVQQMTCKYATASSRRTCAASVSQVCTELQSQLSETANTVREAWCRVLAVNTSILASLPVLGRR